MLYIIALAIKSTGKLVDASDTWELYRVGEKHYVFFSNGTVWSYEDDALYTIE